MSRRTRRRQVSFSPEVNEKSTVALRLDAAAEAVRRSPASFTTGSPSTQYSSSSTTPSRRRSLRASLSPERSPPPPALRFDGDTKRNSPSSTAFSPVRLLKRAGARLVKVAFRVISYRKKASAKSSSCASVPRRLSGGDSHRSEAIEDCIEFINSSCRNSLDSCKNVCMFNQYDLKAILMNDVD